MVCLYSIWRGRFFFPAILVGPLRERELEREGKLSPVVILEIKNTKSEDFFPARKKKKNRLNGRVSHLGPH